MPIRTFGDGPKEVALHPEHKSKLVNHVRYRLMIKGTHKNLSSTMAVEVIYHVPRMSVISKRLRGIDTAHEQVKATLNWCANPHHMFLLYARPVVLEADIEDGQIRSSLP